MQSMKSPCVFTIWCDLSIFWIPLHLEWPSLPFLLLSHLPSAPHPSPWHWGASVLCSLNDMPALTQTLPPHPHHPHSKHLESRDFCFCSFYSEQLCICYKASHSRSDWRLISIWCVNEWLWVQSIYSRDIPLLTFKGKKSQNGKKWAPFTNSHRCWNFGFKTLSQETNITWTVQAQPKGLMGHFGILCA